jgi:hypothetical protein
MSRRSVGALRATTPHPGPLPRGEWGTAPRPEGTLAAPAPGKCDAEGRVPPSPRGGEGGGEGTASPLAGSAP